MQKFHLIVQIMRQSPHRINRILLTFLKLTLNSSVFTTKSYLSCLNHFLQTLQCARAQATMHSIQCLSFDFLMWADFEDCQLDSQLTYRVL